MSGSAWARILAVVAAVAAVAGCGRSAGRSGTPERRAGPPALRAATRPAGAGAAAHRARWTGRAHARGIVDLTAPGSGGALVVAARGRLETLSPRLRPAPFAPAYAAPPGLEPYIVLSSGQEVPGAGCAFAPGSVYALRLAGGDGVTVIGATGAVRRFASLPSRGLENGITFDQTGRFGHRLLVTTSVAGATTVQAIDCHGRVTVVTRRAPRVEGGMVVAPASFGRFGGDLIGPDELSGTIYAISPAGRVGVVAASGVAHGQDVGVESEGFVPARFADALVADRRTLRNRHPGDDLVLGAGRPALMAAGVRPGDLLAVTEGGAVTIAVTCRSSCTVRTVAAGPRIAHVEGHVVFSVAATRRRRAARPRTRRPAGPIGPAGGG